MDKRGIWESVKQYCPNEKGIAGLMGNLQAESGLVFNNLENFYNGKLNMTDEQYTAAVNSGVYTNFINDAAGYGLAQWTYWTRKRGLLDLAHKRGVSIADAQLQLDYLREELTGRYRGVLNAMLEADSVRAASDAVLIGFENPADKSERVKQYRASLGEQILREIAGKISGYIVAADVLNVRAGAGLEYSIVGSLKKGAGCAIVESVKVGGMVWGMLANGKGWVAMEYLKGV